MSNIVIFGAGGQAGTAAAAEASARGHHVTALGRGDADVTDPQAVARAALGKDAAIVAVAPSDGDPVEFYRVAATSLADGLVHAGVDRLVWVSIGTLLPDIGGVAPVDADGFPAKYLPFSLGHRAALEVFSRTELSWTAVSPAGDFDRTGGPRVGYVLSEVVALGAQISYADHACALVDIAEQPGAHVSGHVGVLRPPSDAAVPTIGGAVAGAHQ
ncbi:NAD(P)-dependent oxidoreductase [Streptomyces fractus]|uniref:NAD(P)-dependent oxidoreductase n=1 Tax=Streptomyces fractus TaxID=641806 RepID=UPI003CEB19C0